MNLIYPVTLPKVLFALLMLIILASIFHAPTKGVIYHLTDQFFTPEDRKLREQARYRNKPFKEYKAEVLARKNWRKRNADIAQAIHSGNLSSLDSLLSQSKERMKIDSDIYRIAIDAEALGALQVIHQHKFNCRPVSPPVAATAESYYNHKTEQASVRAIKDASNPDIVAEWVALGCHKERPNFIKHLVSRGEAEKLINVPINSDNASLWQELIWRSVLAKKQTFAADWIPKVWAQVSNKGEFAFTVPASLDSDRKDILEQSLRGELPMVVKAILDTDPSHIKRERSTGTVMRLLSVRNLGFPIDSFLDNRLDLASIEEELPAYWKHSVRRGDLGMMRLLWSYDQDFRLSQFVADELTSLDRSLRNGDVKYFPILVNKGLDYRQFEYQGLDQLSQAVGMGDVDLVSAILEIGVNPGLLYRGRSMLSTHVRADAPTRAKIESLLRRKGATEKLHKLADEASLTACQIGRKVPINPYHDDYIDPIKETMRKDGRISLSSYRVCESALLVCTESNVFGLDDCFETIRACPKRVDEEGFRFGTLLVPACCPAAAKQRYNDLRCSGLEPEEASHKMVDMGFSLDGQTPIFLRNAGSWQR